MLDGSCVCCDRLVRRSSLKRPEVSITKYMITNPTSPNNAIVDREKVSGAVDRVCAAGCTYVTETIAALNDGRDVAEAAGLNPDERQVLVDELTAIMSVYDGTCET